MATNLTDLPGNLRVRGDLLLDGDIIADHLAKPFTATVGFSEADYIVDGVNDNVEFQQAIAAVISAGGGEIFLKAGNYHWGGSPGANTGSNVPISISGEGAATHIDLDGNYLFFFHNGNEDGSFVRDIFIDANDSDQSVISFGTGEHKNTLFANVTITNCAHNAIVHNGYNFNVNNCNLENVFSGIQSNTQSSGADRLCFITNSRITNVSYTDPGTEGIDLNWHGSPNSFAIVRNNFISGFRQDGLDINANFVTVSGNIIIQPNFDGITQTSSILVNTIENTANGVISNNIVLNVVGQGIFYPNNATISIMNNYVSGATVMGRGYGIRLTAPVSASVTIVGNNLVGLNRGISNEMAGAPAFPQLLNNFVNCAVDISGNAIALITRQIQFTQRVDFTNGLIVFGLNGTSLGQIRLDPSDASQPAFLMKGFVGGVASIETASGSNRTVRFQNTSSGKLLTEFLGRSMVSRGTTTAAAADLTLPFDGNSFIISGNTTINAIITTGWIAGSEIKLVFTGSPTVKNNTAGGAGTAPILLSGGIDFTASNPCVLTLIYDGTNWQESGRSINHV